MRCPAILLFFGCLAGCSFVFDGTPPDLPLVGAPPNMSALPRLNRAPVTQSGVLMGVDGAPWAALLEGWHWRLVRLAPPDAEEVLEGGVVQLQGDAFYITEKFADGVGEPASFLRVHVPGGAEQGFSIPGEVAPIIVAGGGGRAFAWFADRIYGIARRDGSVERTLRLPEGLSPATPTTAESPFSSSDAWFFERDPMDHLIARSGTDRRDVDLGTRPGQLAAGSDDSLWICGAEGLRHLELPSTDEQIVDGACNLILSTRKEAVYYRQGNALYKASPTEAPRLLADLEGHRLLQVTDDDRVIYSTDLETRYAHGAGDGWLDGWRFMERGIDVTSARDGSELRWLEHAATTDGAGQLLAASPGQSGSRLLARNVRFYDELADGRVLAAANQAFAGPHSRIVVIDERRDEARWVAAGSTYYTMIPGTADALVGVVGAWQLPEHDVVRVTIPPR
jgi:hypothetical protein